MTIFQSFDYRILIIILAVAIFIFSRFIIKGSRYVYASGVIINPPKDQITFIETKYEAIALEANTMSYYEVRIDKKGNNHKFIKNHRWVKLDIDPEEAKSFIEHYESGEEHPILNLMNSINFSE